MKIFYYNLQKDTTLREPLRYNAAMDERYEIIIVSDNHGMSMPLYDLLSQYPDADYFFHLGDSEMPYGANSLFACVRGNNDWDPEYPDELFLTIGKFRFFLTHGHLYGCSYSLDPMKTIAKRKECDIVCFGHTHVYMDYTEDGVRFLNPGSIRANRDGSEPSYMHVVINGDQISVERITYSFSLQR